MEALTIGSPDGSGFQTAPGVSRFAGSILELDFSDGSTLAIHRSIVVEGCPKLALLLGSSTTRVNFGGYSSLAGHALVSYLYTGRYEIPGWTSPVDPSVDLGLLDLKTQFQIYALAKAVALSGLEEQARSTIEQLARNLDFGTVIDAVKEGYPIPASDDSWFQPWITSTIKSALQNPGTSLSRTTQGALRFGDDASVIKVIFECMRKTYSEMMELLSDPDRDDHADLDTPAGDTSSEMSELFAVVPGLPQAHPTLFSPALSTPPRPQGPADASGPFPDAILIGRSWTAASMSAPPADNTPRAEVGPEVEPVEDVGIPGITVVDSPLGGIKKKKSKIGPRTKKKTEVIAYLNPADEPGAASIESPAEKAPEGTVVEPPKIFGWGY
ncbi:hypothetical protein C8A05DRAFT_38495 [Staphylotrichum tortipilum]|uniref:BTB domain-containing protein n=1 Tax=Staphylotrichum tortipilum TaxID=2831512 RepID=A0AAN6MD30_9PEZI|nr:hypothetical protein C8A05DRAFT_38495 [Staphylotrichum longicolle]